MRRIFSDYLCGICCLFALCGDKACLEKCCAYCCCYDSRCSHFNKSIHAYECNYEHQHVLAAHKILHILGIAKEQNQQPANDDSFELKYMGETKRIGREEMIALAQKGMDYDRIREERDKMSPELDGLRSDKTKLTEYEGFLAKLAESVGMDIPAMIESTQAKMLVADEAKKGNTITEDFALQRIRFEREKADFEKQKGRKDSDKPKEDGQAKAESGKQTPEEEIAKARRDDEAKAFLKEYPEVDPKTIPKEVMNKWMGGTPLINAYMVYENKKLKADLAAMEQNMKNSGRSTGSVKSAGAGRATDPVFAGWDD